MQNISLKLETYAAFVIDFRFDPRAAPEGLENYLVFSQWKALPRVCGTQPCNGAQTGLGADVD